MRRMNHVVQSSVLEGAKGIAVVILITLLSEKCTHKGQDSLLVPKRVNISIFVSIIRPRDISLRALKHNVRRYVYTQYQEVLGHSLCAASGLGGVGSGFS